MQFQESKSNNDSQKLMRMSRTNTKNSRKNSGCTNPYVLSLFKDIQDKEDSSSPRGIGGAARYGLVVQVFALGLLSKGMLVTLPFVLLLLDLWPLGRWRCCPPL